MIGNREIENALRHLIRGDGVRRASHDLMINGQDVSGLSRSLLAHEGYLELRIDDVSIRPGERVPAFCITTGQAHCGWVFWDVFSPERRPKIFGSVARNEKGDWAIVLSRTALVWLCLSRAEEMDVDRPSSL